MEDKLFELVGLAVPFYLAAATYGVFFWLDSNASDEATQVISLWLRGHSHNKPDLGNLIINAFDQIYTSPLLSFQAFRRSAAISTIIWLIVFFGPSVGYTVNYYIVHWNDLILGYPPSESIPILIALSLGLLFVTVLSDLFDTFCGWHKLIPLELALFHRLSVLL